MDMDGDWWMYNGCGLLTDVWLDKLVAWLVPPVYPGRVCQSVCLLPTTDYSRPISDLRWRRTKQINRPRRPGRSQAYDGLTPAIPLALSLQINSRYRPCVSQNTRIHSSNA